MPITVDTVGPEGRSELLTGSPRPQEHTACDPGHQVMLNLAMTGGEGEGSYAKNSGIQAGGFRFAQSKLEAAILSMSLSQKGLFKIADMGCSSGPNAVAQMDFIVRTLNTRYALSTLPTPEFQAFFVDLLSNDFNNLFRLIGHNEIDSPSSFHPARSETEYFSAGVAGSFYNRLLPRRSLDIVFSSFSLHWLSKIPDAVQQPDSPAYNDGSVWIQDGKSVVGSAYALQAKQDMCDFLRARAVEIVPGGLMFLLMTGRKDSDPTKQTNPAGSTMFGFHMEEVFKELISEGSLEAAKRDSLNIPLYYRTIDEIKEALEEVQEFTIIRVELLDNVPRNSWTLEELLVSPEECGRRIVNICRSLLGVLIEHHIGKVVTDQFFSKLEKRAVERSKAEARQQKVMQFDVNLVVLSRK